MTGSLQNTKELLTVLIIFVIALVAISKFTIHTIDIKKDIKMENKAEWLDYTVTCIIKPDASAMQVEGSPPLHPMQFTHTGWLRIEDINSIFVSSNELYLNAKNGLNLTYAFNSNADALSVRDGLKIAMTATPGHKMEVVGLLKTETK